MQYPLPCISHRGLWWRWPVWISLVGRCLAIRHTGCFVLSHFRSKFSFHSCCMIHSVNRVRIVTGRVSAKSFHLPPKCYYITLLCHHQLL